MMKIESLNLEYAGETIISDIDDCLMYTSMSLVSFKLNPKVFFFNDEIYENYKYEVFKATKLSEWGKEFVDMLKSGCLSDYLLMTSAKNRMEIIMEKFGLSDSSKIIENISDERKVVYLNFQKVSTIYIDDKHRVLGKISNPLVKCVAWPV